MALDSPADDTSASPLPWKKQRRPSLVSQVLEMAHGVLASTDGLLRRHDANGFWAKNRSMALMLLAQMVSSGMAVAAKLLQTAHMGMEAISERQALITIMSIATVSSWIWLYFGKVADAPLGARDVWGLLTVRGIGGVIGLFGFYFSLRYLTVSEAVVINFLAPMVATFALGMIRRLPSSVIQLCAGLMSIGGVVLIAQPWHEAFQVSATDPHHTLDSALCQGCASHMGSSMGMGMGMSNIDVEPMMQRRNLTAGIHSLAIAGALLGVAGGAISYVVMGLIDKRAHPLVTVHHFAAWTVILSSASLIFSPPTDFRMPIPMEWALLAFLGLSSPVLQSLVAASLQGPGNLAALNMTYTQIVFSLFMDKFIWGVTPNWIGLLGSAIVVGSVVIVAVTQQRQRQTVVEVADEPDVSDEEAGLMRGEEHEMEMVGTTGNSKKTLQPDYDSDELSPGYDL